MPEPNGNLERLYHETGWTLGQFARAVNRVGTERNTPLKYREPSVHQWLRGHLPRERVRPLVLEALSRRLERRISPSEAGFPVSSQVGSVSASTVDDLIDLGRQDMDPSRRGLLGAGLFSVALTVPNWPDVVGRLESAHTGRTRRIGMSEVEVVSQMTRRISELDDQFGGRHARPMAVAFLVNTVGPYLRCDGPEAVRKAMLSAASDLCYLTGYMAVDEGAQGLAQRYYVKALRLAGAAEDHLTYCTTLRGMSVQSAALRHGKQAARLADAAAVAVPQASPRMRAFLAGQQAHSDALIGDRHGALRHLTEAESAMEKAESREATFGSYDPSALYFHIGHVRHELGDLPGAVQALRESEKLCSPVYRRTLVNKRATLAELQYQLGHLEAACTTWHRALDDYPHVHSGRVDERLHRMCDLLTPHLANPTARDLHDRSRRLLPAAPVA